MSSLRLKTTILDRSISKGKNEVSLNCFALLFSEIVQYCQNRVSTVPELQAKYIYFYSRPRWWWFDDRTIFDRLSEFGQQVGIKMLDLLIVREKSGKREIKLLQILIFIKSTVWKVHHLRFVHNNRYKFNSVVLVSFWPRSWQTGAR